MMTLCIHMSFLILLHVAAYQNQKSEFVVFGLCFSLVSYLYVLATKKNMRFQVSSILNLPSANEKKRNVRAASWVFLKRKIQVAQMKGRRD